MTTKPEEAKAENQLAAFIDRILRLKTEADDIASDIKEIYQEAHANGFNKTRLGEVVTHLRKVEKDANGEAEKAALRDLYLDAYYRAKGLPHAHTREEQPEHDAETGEITEPQSPQPAAQTVLDGGPVFPSPVESEAVEISTPIQPETATEVTHDTTNGGSHESAAARPVPVIDPGRRHDTETNEDRTHALEVAITSAPIVTGEGAHIASVTPIRPAKLYRPLCQNRDRCGSSGPKECWKCIKVAEQGSAA